MISSWKVHSIYKSDRKKLLLYFQFALYASIGLKKEQQFIYQYEDGLKFGLLAITTKRSTTKIIEDLRAGDMASLQQITQELEHFL